MTVAAAGNIGLADAVEHGRRESRTIVANGHGDRLRAPGDAYSDAITGELYRVLDDVAQAMIEFRTIGNHGLGAIVVTRSIDIQRELAELDTTQKGASIAPPPTLVKHTKAWLEKYLENDEGAASVDVIADRRASWQDLTRVVFGTSSVGFYKLYLVTSREDGSLGAVETAAPIFGSLPGLKKPVPLVLGYYPLEEASGFRVSQGSAVLEDEDSCDKEMSFCIADGGEFDKRLAALAAGMRAKKPDNPSFAMFATTGDVTVGAAMSWLERVGAGLSIPQRRVFIGYIER